jgi:hypothetical protein
MRNILQPIPCLLIEPCHACRLWRQELARGYVAKDQELHGERAIGVYKFYVEGRVCQHPEMAFGNDVRALQRCRQFSTAYASLPPLRDGMMRRMIQGCALLHDRRCSCSGVWQT